MAQVIKLAFIYICYIRAAAAARDINGSARKSPRRCVRYGALFNLERAKSEMNRLNIQALALALALAITAPADAASTSITPTHLLSAHDGESLFGASTEPLQLTSLSSDEMNRTQGAFLWMAFGMAGSATGLARSFFHRHPLERRYDGSIESLKYAVYRGAITGSIAVGTYFLFKSAQPKTAEIQRVERSQGRRS